MSRQAGDVLPDANLDTHTQPEPNLAADHPAHGDAHAFRNLDGNRYRICHANQLSLAIAKPHGEDDAQPNCHLDPITDRHGAIIRDAQPNATALQYRHAHPAAEDSHAGAADRYPGAAPAANEHASAADIDGHTGAADEHAGAADIDGHTSTSNQHVGATNINIRAHRHTRIGAVMLSWATVSRLGYHQQRSRDS